LIQSFHLRPPRVLKEFLADSFTHCLPAYFARNAGPFGFDSIDGLAIMFVYLDWSSMRDIPKVLRVYEIPTKGNKR
jgi:hypothetical protein